MIIMAGIADLPMLHDIDADYSPQYVKLARVLRDTPPGSEQGRGLQIVEALSAHWGWYREDGGKAVFAVLARKA